MASKGVESASTTPLGDHIVLKSLEDIHEPIDARLSLSSRPPADQLDESLGHQLSHIIQHPREAGPPSSDSTKNEKSSFDSETEPIYVRRSPSF